MTAQTACNALKVTVTLAALVLFVALFSGTATAHEGNAARQTLQSAARVPNNLTVSVPVTHPQTLKTSLGPSRPVGEKISDH